MQIKFWRPENSYGIFSNFAYTPLTIDGVEYATAEKEQEKEEVPS